MTRLSQIFRSDDNDDMAMQQQGEDVQLLADIQREWDKRKEDGNLPENIRTPFELSTMVSRSDDGYGRYMCKKCPQTYQAVPWIIKHLMQVHLSPDIEKLYYCSLCNTSINCEKAENKEKAYQRHVKSNNHQLAIRFPTICAKGRQPFCPNPGCYKIFNSAAAGRKHKVQCDEWSIEKRQMKKSRYLEEDEAKKRMGRQAAVSSQLGSMQWDTA